MVIFNDLESIYSNDTKNNQLFYLKRLVLFFTRSAFFLVLFFW